jgi:hypothetical protein
VIGPCDFKTASPAAEMEIEAVVGMFKTLGIVENDRVDQQQIRSDVFPMIFFEIWITRDMLVQLQFWQRKLNQKFIIHVHYS